MKKTIILVLLLFLFNFSQSQVGINTDNPSAALDVVGTVKLEGKLYLEDPGEQTVTRGAKLLVNATDGKVKEYDITNSKYGPINVAQYRFRSTSSYGVVNYDTKVPIDDYILTVQGFYFQQPGSGSTNVLLHSNITDDNIEGYQFYPYKNTTTNTWYIRAFVNNSEFRTISWGSFYDSTIDIFLNVIIYRNKFIAKELPAVTVDMGNSETATAPLPAGF